MMDAVIRVATTTSLVVALTGAASARELSVVSWGGTYQDAQRKVYFEPFEAKTGTPLTLHAKKARTFASSGRGASTPSISWVILEGSPNARQAEALIAFMSDAERQARPPEFISYGVTNKAAMASIPPDLLENLPSAPENLAVSVPIDVSIAGTTGVRLG